jgi:hypothetical protein
MRIKIIAKTPDPKDSSHLLSPNCYMVHPGTIAKVVNADTGETIQGVTKLELFLNPNEIIHAKLEVEVLDLDIDIDAEVVNEPDPLEQPTSGAGVLVGNPNHSPDEGIYLVH